MPMKTIVHHLVGPVRLGPIPAPKPEAAPPLPFRDYLKAGAPLSGAAVSSDWALKALPAIRQIYKNNVWGCCVISFLAHQEGVWTGNVTGTPIIFPDGAIETEYEIVGGFDPNNAEATDNGCNPETALDHCVQSGFGGRPRWAGWLSVDATNAREVEIASDEFGGLMACLGLPDAWVADNMAMMKPYATLDVAGPANPQNGHCTGMVARLADGRCKIMTWGFEVYFTEAALAAYCVPSASGALYAGVSPDWADAVTKRTPSHIDYARLIADMKARAASLAAAA